MPEKKQKLDGLKVLLGVSGGIAAYKAVDLASKLTAAGAQVRTVMTQNALQLVGAKSFEAVTGQSVYTSMWQDGQEFEIGHVSIADWADVIVVAPATANIIGKVANGICDDLLSTTLCVCWMKPMIFAPAMNDKMWKNRAVQKNVKTLKHTGIELIGPAHGRLACGTEGVGRMAEPLEILEVVRKAAAAIKRKRK
ncbi:MAG: phosphopantothenoylcysteine decarboxylase [Sedimentisphaerales bacterium]|nr:phosphopantothenoylcysteine decarboxylase [Sedimentisphaerales bacterium]